MPASNDDKPPPARGKHPASGISPLALRMLERLAQTDDDPELAARVKRAREAQWEAESQQ